jgi:hypothetical protein
VRLISLTRTPLSTSYLIGDSETLFTVQNSRPSVFIGFCRRKLP